MREGEWGRGSGGESGRRVPLLAILGESPKRLGLLGRFVKVLSTPQLFCIFDHVQDPKYGSQQAVVGTRLLGQVTFRFSSCRGRNWCPASVASCYGAVSDSK